MKYTFTLISTLLAAATTVTAANVPYTHSLIRRSVHIPPTLLEKKDSLHVRQGTCGYLQVACDSGGCCEGSCCGDGCCPLLWTCEYVGSTPGCCPVGEICSDQISGCTDNSLVECPSPYDFCCPSGEACSLDSAGNAQCGGTTVGTGNDNGNNNNNNNDETTSTFRVTSTTQLAFTTTHSTTTTSHTTSTPLFVNNPDTTSKAINSASSATGGAEKLAVGGGISAFVVVMAGLVL